MKILIALLFVVLPTVHAAEAVISFSNGTTVELERVSLIASAAGTNEIPMPSGAPYDSHVVDIEKATKSVYIPAVVNGYWTAIDIEGYRNVSLSPGPTPDSRRVLVEYASGQRVIAIIPISTGSVWPPIPRLDVVVVEGRLGDPEGRAVEFTSLSFIRKSPDGCLVGAPSIIDGTSCQFMLRHVGNIPVVGPSLTFSTGRETASLPVRDIVSIAIDNNYPDRPTLLTLRGNRTIRGELSGLGSVLGYDAKGRLVFSNLREIREIQLRNF